MIRWFLISHLMFTTINILPFESALAFMPTQACKRQTMPGLRPSIPLGMASVVSEVEVEKGNDKGNILLSRRTVNEFEKDLPEDWEACLRRAIEAAIYAPNHKRTEPWRFHLLGEQSIQRVCKLNAELVSAKKGQEAGEKKLRRWLEMPGWLVVTCVKKSPEVNAKDEDEEKGNQSGRSVSNRMKRWLTTPLRMFSKRNVDSASNNESLVSMDDPSGVAREDYAACCCAVQNLCLSLHADGIGTKWTTGPVNFDPRFANAVGMPSNEYVVGTIWFGTPASVPKAPIKKLGVSDVLTIQK